MKKILTACAVFFYVLHITAISLQPGQNVPDMLLLSEQIHAFLEYPETAHAEPTDPIGNAKNGIVGVFSGVTDREGTFFQMKSGSGFLICNAEGTTYIVTNYSIIHNSGKEKTAYREEHGIDDEQSGMTDVIRVAVKGDVTIEASVLTLSEEMNVCILSTENAVNEKTALKLGDSNAMATGDPVYALGFPKDTKSTEFQASDVEIFQGNVQDKASYPSGTEYIQHSAVISEGNAGGPILDAEGYVVGINCSEYSDAASGRYYSLPVNELIEVLDNFSVNYGSKKKDVLKRELEKLQQECVQLKESGEYKKDSLEGMQIALSEVEKLSETEHPALQEMEEVYQQLEQAKDALVPKMKKITIAIYVFAVFIVLVFLFLLRILLLNRRDQKKEITANQEEYHSERETGSSKNKERQFYKKEKEENGRDSMCFPENWEEKTIGLSSYKKEHSGFCDERDKFQRKTTRMELVRKRNGQIVTIDKPEYLIGKNPGQADLSVPDNKAVSKKHAGIVWKNNEYYVYDFNSTNGTYVKDKKIPEGILVKLSDGDSLTLADEVFIIKIREISV